MKTLILKLTCAIVIGGEVLRAGSLVEVSRGEARDLLSRGKAELHAHDPESGDEVTSSGGTDPDLHPDLADYNADQEAARAAAATDQAAEDATTDAATDPAQDAQGAAQDATADAGTSDQAATPDAPQAAAQAPAGNGRRRR